MSQGKFIELDYVRVKSGNPKISRKYWGKSGRVLMREGFLIRKIFRVDYTVAFVKNNLETGVFKEDDLEFDH